jgi:hypothetical protein
LRRDLHSCNYSCRTISTKSFLAEAENINKTNMKYIKKETQEALGKAYEKGDKPPMPYE